DTGGTREVDRLKDVFALSISPDGRRALLGAPDLVLCKDLETGEELIRIKHQGLVDYATFSPDGRRAAFSSGSAVRIWALPPGRQPGETPALVEVARFVSHDGGVNVAVLSPDGRHILCGTDDQTMILWDRKTGRLIRRFDMRRGTMLS